MESDGGTCDICGNRSLLPYKCRYCGGRFCPDHRLPENHDCDGLRRLRENPRWRDYATQVKRRNSSVSQPSHREKWDREEEKRGRLPIGGIRMPGSSSWYPSGQADAAKKNIVIILLMALTAAMIIRFLL